MRPIQILAFVLICAVVALGQTNKGGISGTVIDPNGAAVPGATVTVTNLGTNQATTVTTSESGAFSVSSLDPVTYSVAVEMAGFRKALVQSVKVDTASTVGVNVQLEAGAISEEVSVSAEASLINTESGTSTSTISERQIQEVPLSNRSVLDLAVTAPNVTGDAGSEDPGVSADQPVPGFNLSVNGGRPGSTAILADGVNNTGVGIARAVVSFTPETVQEFTVQTSAYSAEYGTTGGGTINVTTKAGTNDLNGVALWYTRNPYFNARPWRQGTAPRPANNLRYNQVSISVGGPIYLPKPGEGGSALYDGHDRSFFFFAYEPRWRKDFLTSTALLPSLAERSGDFRNLVRTNSGFLPADVAARFNQASVGIANIYQQFTLDANGVLRPIALAAGNQFCQFGDTRAIIINGQPQCTPTTNANAIPGLNVIPAGFLDPTALRLRELIPAPGDYFDDAGFVRNYVLQRFVIQNETRYTLRLDHNFTNNAKANFRYTKTPAIGIRGAGNDVNGNTGVYSDAKQMLVAFNNIFSPTMVNDLRLNYTKGNFSEDFSPEFSIKGGRSLAREFGLPALTTGGIPLFFLTQDLGYVGADIGAGGSTNNFNVEQRYNLSDILYWTRGDKTWKFGVDISDARLQVTPFFAAAGGRWQFRTVNTSNNRGTGLANGGNDLASFLIGVPNAVDVRPLLLDYNYQWKSYAAFVQNDWKVRPNLTLNLGVRYSLQYPRTEKNNLQGVFRPDLAMTVTLTDAQRRATATGLGVATTAPIPSTVPTTVSIPPFAFAGQGGRSKYITGVDYTGIEPRFGFAWSPKMKIFGFDLESRSVVIRGGYGISHAPLTGNNRSPNPDFGGFTTVSTVLTTTVSGACPAPPCASTGTADVNQPVRLSSNPPLQGSATPLNTLLGTDANGLVFLNSIGIPAVADSGFSGGGSKVPYSQNWNLAVQFEPFKNTVVELAYVGNKGTHLYMPLVNINQRDVNFVSGLETSGLDATTAFADPLGRRNLLGAVVTIPRGSVASPFFGFDRLNRFFDPSANSIRHAVYIDVRRRIRQGLTFTANYTFGKSIDDASDASPDTRVLSTGSVAGQVSLGAPRSIDRSLSTYDVKHNFSSTFIWDLPIGKGRRFLSGMPGIIDTILGKWTMSGVFRMPGGTPFLPFITDANKLGGASFNRVVRPDIVQGVPLKNPLWSPNCMVGAQCEPFINPAAFMRPVKGQLGNAPRSLDIRPPRQEFFDFSLSKDFAWPFFSKEGKRRINFRVDLINAFNHPNFRFANTGNVPPGFGTFPTEITSETEPFGTGTRGAVITTAEFNNWVAFDPARRSSVSITDVRNNINTVRLPSGALPNDFFHVQVPQGFATTNFNAFDIRTLEGFRLFRLRQSYNPDFGTLTAGFSQPRYIQFGLRIFF
ncbi:MAG TPA: carboxypeptidase regulatory-like domain-containing protein [Pyrinomonadaceae bacterium]|jgi:outer membrane receptor protein involved in Fe transport